jgi:hypothetical protein
MTRSNLLHNLVANSNKDNVCLIQYLQNRLCSTTLTIHQTKSLFPPDHVEDLNPEECFFTFSIELAGTHHSPQRRFGDLFHLQREWHPLWTKVCHSRSVQGSAGHFLQFTCSHSYDSYVWCRSVQPMCLRPLRTYFNIINKITHHRILGSPLTECSNWTTGQTRTRNFAILL